MKDPQLLDHTWLGQLTDQKGMVRAKGYGQGERERVIIFVFCNEILNTPWCTSLVTRYYYYYCFGLGGGQKYPVL